uniref:Uncharacterized protein n=1 Tax=Poecilia latipinna TaxID=48699 RepID=A0A3B3UV89_9TELE
MFLFWFIVVFLISGVFSQQQQKNTIESEERHIKIKHLTRMYGSITSAVFNCGK